MIMVTITPNDDGLPRKVITMINYKQSKPNVKNFITLKQGT